MPFVIGAACFMTVVYLVAARREEKKFSHSPFQKDYQTYSESTGAFFPKPLRRKAS
jgi:protein-S-isoprenylcysteine O-methyltransferase Ste14